ncbi:MAG: VWA domain-containing protein [Planctomycetes bacterium]|nr:VWA domain-containing protein [Planctomycetota bacterium]
MPFNPLSTIGLRASAAAAWSARSSLRGFLGLLALAALFCAPAAPAWADGFIIIDEPPLPPRHIPERARYFPLSVKSHKVTVDIKKHVAVTRVDQVFHNPNAMQLEGTYIFPLPLEASVDRFSMWMDGVEVHGEVLEREKARNIYENIVRKMQDPALLEYIGQGAFKCRVFPIPANGDKRVALEYTQVLAPDGGLVRYTYPLNTEKFSFTPLEECVVDVRIVNGAPIRNVYSPTHPVDVKKLKENAARATYEARNVRPDKDFTLYYSLSEKDFGLSLLTYKKRDGEDGFFVMMLSPKTELKEDEVIQKDVVFVLDTSGSMAGEKMEQARKALTMCVSGLNKGDRFNVVSFSTDVRPWKKGLVNATPEEVKQARQHIEEELKPVGGTDIHDALLAALKMGGDGADDAAKRPFMIVFITDGKPTVGEIDHARIWSDAQKANARQARVFVCGVGYDVNAVLLDKIADDSNATREYVTEKEDLEVKIGNFFKKVSSPVLANIDVGFDNLKVYDVYPRKLPDLFHGTQITVYGRYKEGGDRAVRLSGMVNGEKREFVFEDKFAAERNKNDFVARLWARRKIAFLLDNIRLNGERDELKNEIIELSKQYGIVTPYTSYLVTEDMVPTTRNRGAPGGRDGDDGRFGIPDQFSSSEGRRSRGGPSQGTPPTTTAPPTPSMPGDSLGLEGLRDMRGNEDLGALSDRLREFLGNGQPRAEEAPSAGGGRAGGGAGEKAGAAGPAPTPAPSADSVRRRQSEAMGRYAKKAEGKEGVEASKAIEKDKSAYGHGQSFDESLTLQRDDAAGGAGASGGADVPTSGERAARAISKAIKSVAGKTFYLIDGRWQDAAYDAKKHKNVKKVEYLSTEYFDLLKKDADMGKYLALGQRVLLVLGDQAIEIVPAPEKK